MRGRTYAVGVLLVDMVNPFLPEVIAGVKAAVTDANYKLLIAVGEAEAAIERSLIDSMIDMRMDGLILVAPRLSGELLAGYARQIPMVVVGHHEPTATDFDTVNSDDESGARLAVESLIAKGHRAIHMVSLLRRDDDYSVYFPRETGYLGAMKAAGLADEIKIWRMPQVLRDSNHEIAELFGSEPLPSALFCWSDLHAIPILNHAKLNGIEVPGRLAIVGYDNSSIAAQPLISLSSVEQSGRELGRIAGQRLLSRIDADTQAEHLLLPPSLKLRTSN